MATKDGEFPHSCAVKHVNTKVTLLVNLKGLVDFAQELKKLQNQLKTVQGRKDTLEGKMGMETYVKVPEDVKARDAKKLEELKDEVKKIEESIVRFEALAKAEWRVC